VVVVCNRNSHGVGVMNMARRGFAPVSKVQRIIATALVQHIHDVIASNLLMTLVFFWPSADEVDEVDVKT